MRPGRDEKILTSWNALMIKGMAPAGRLLERRDWIDSAERALRYLMEHHWHDGRLLATSRDGKAQLNAYLDDYAYLIDALLELLQARWHSEYLEFACSSPSACSSISRTRSTAASSSPRTTTKPWSIVPSRWPTTPCRAATASPSRPCRHSPC